MHEGDIVLYNLRPYNADVTIVVTIIEIYEDRHIKVKPFEPWPHQHWPETVIIESDHIVDYIYSLAPRTPPR